MEIFFFQQGINFQGTGIQTRDFSPISLNHTVAFQIRDFDPTWCKGIDGGRQYYNKNYGTTLYIPANDDRTYQEDDENHRTYDANHLFQRNGKTGTTERRRTSGIFVA